LPQPLAPEPFTWPGFHPAANNDETSGWLKLDCWAALKIDNNSSLEYLGGWELVSTWEEPTGMAEMTAGSAVVDESDSGRVWVAFWLEGVVEVRRKVMVPLVDRPGRDLQ
jgi:hypothetical protein